MDSNPGPWAWPSLTSETPSHNFVKCRKAFVNVSVPYQTKIKKTNLGSTLYIKASLWLTCYSYCIKSRSNYLSVNYKPKLTTVNHHLFMRYYISLIFASKFARKFIVLRDFVPTLLSDLLSCFKYQPMLPKLWQLALFCQVALVGLTWKSSNICVNVKSLLGFF